MDSFRCYNAGPHFTDNNIKYVNESTENQGVVCIAYNNSFFVSAMYCLLPKVHSKVDLINMPLADSDRSLLQPYPIARLSFFPPSSIHYGNCRKITETRSGLLLDFLLLDLLLLDSLISVARLDDQD